MAQIVIEIFYLLFRSIKICFTSSLSLQSFTSCFIICFILLSYAAICHSFISILLLRNIFFVGSTFREVPETYRFTFTETYEPCIIFCSVKTRKAVNVTTRIVQVSQITARNISLASRVPTRCNQCFVKGLGHLKEQKFQGQLFPSKNFLTLFRKCISCSHALVAHFSTLQINLLDNNKVLTEH